MPSNVEVLRINRLNWFLLSYVVCGYSVFRSCTRRRRRRRAWRSISWRCYISREFRRRWTTGSDVCCRSMSTPSTTTSDVSTWVVFPFARCQHRSLWFYVTDEVRSIYWHITKVRAKVRSYKNEQKQLINAITSREYKTRKLWYRKDDRAMHRQKYIQTASPPPKITWLSVDTVQPDVMDGGLERTFSPQNFSTFPGS